MVFPLALALMAAGGYRKVKQDRSDEDRQAKIDADADEDRAFRREERARMRTTRNDVAAAAAPRSVEDGTVYQPEVDDSGVPMLPNPTAGTFKADGQRFTDRAGAEAAVMKANTPQAEAQRVAGAYMKSGDYAAGQAVRTGARQSEVADLQLDEIKRKRLDEAFDRDITQANSHDDLARIMSESKGDGRGGQLKMTAVKSPDGTTTYHEVKADGTTKPTRFTFKEQIDPQTGRDLGLIQAQYMLSKGVSAKDKLDHMIGGAKTAEDRQRWEKEFGLKEKGEDRRAAHDKATLANASARVGIARMAAGAKAGPAAATPDSTFDAKTAADIAKDQVQKEGDEARATGKPWTGAQIAKRTDEIVQSLRQSHTARFVEETVARQLGAAQADPQQYAVLYQQAVQLGMPPQKLAQLGFKPPGGAAVAPAAAAPARQAPPIGPATPQAAMTPRADPNDPVEKAGLEVDAARAKATAAQAKLAGYGLRQKAADPQSFAKAEQEARTAQEMLRAAAAAYKELAGGSQAAFRYATP